MNDSLSRFGSDAAMPSDPKALAIFARLVRGAGVVTVAVGLFVLAGWAWDIAVFRSVVAGFATMKPNTALAFVLAGISLLVLLSDMRPRGMLAVTLACSTVVVAIGLLTLGEHLLGRDAGIDLILFAKAVSAAGDPAPGRMTPVTALVFLLAGVALQILALPGRYAANLAQVPALIALAISASALLGFAYNVDALYRVPMYGRIALHTTVLCFVLSGAIVLATAVRIESSLIVSEGTGGMMLRRLWPSSIGALVILSALRFYGEEAGLYGSEVGLALMVVLATVVLTTLIWIIGRRLDLMDAERKRGEIALRSSESRLKDIMASVAEGIVSVDEDYRIVLFNPAAEQIFGRSREEMFGQPLGLLVPERFRAQHEKHIRAFAATGQTHRSMGRYGLIYGLRASGKEFPIEATISQTGTGRNRLFTVILHDVTERMRVEVEREQLLGVLEASLNEIYIFDTDTLRFQYVNPSALRNLRYSADAVRVMTPLDLKQEFNAASFRELVAPLLRGEQELKVFQTTHRRADGSLYPVEVHLQLVGRGAQRVFLAVIFDITERLRAEWALRDYAEQMRQLSRRLFETQEDERRRLSRELHDRIGQNVTALTLSLNMVRSELPAEHLQKLGVHLNDCETLLYSTGQLVRDVMVELRPPGLDELGLLAALTEYARHLASISGFSAVVNGTEVTPRLPPEMEITLFRIAQEALMNVAKHARATEATVALEADPNRVVMTISDNGRGFDPAERLPDAALHLGMVNMRERAEAIGGRLHVESALGRGTRVVVETPRANHKPSNQPHLPGIEPV